MQRAMKLDSKKTLSAKIRPPNPIMTLGTHTIQLPLDTNKSINVYSIGWKEANFYGKRSVKSRPTNLQVGGRVFIDISLEMAAIWFWRAL